MHWVLVANGDMSLSPRVHDILKSADVLIGVDGGGRHLHALGLTPQMMLGDMDSITADILHAYRAQGIPQQLHPTKKDATDLELALDHALASGATHVTILGATGDRPDHTLGNICLLHRCLEGGVPAAIVDAGHSIHLTAGTLCITGDPGDTVSIVPATDEVTGITLTGLEYPLVVATLHRGTTRGISNVLVARQATVQVRTGRLFVFHLYGR